MVTPSGWQSKYGVQSVAAGGMQEWELPRRCKGVLIVIENTDIVPISAWRKEGREFSLEKIFERGVLEVCGALKGNTWQRTGGLVGGELWKCEGTCSLARG